VSSFPYLIRRLLVAVVGIALLVVVILLEIPPLTVFLFAFTAGLAAWEATRLLVPGAGNVPSFLAVLLTGGAAAAVATGTAYHGVALVFPGVLLSIYWLASGGVKEARIRLASSTGVYAVIALGFGLLTRHALLSDRVFLIGIPLLICWFGDSLAYFVGSPFGRHKLIPSVSPAKSWEGLAAGLAGAIAGAITAGSVLGNLPIWQMAFTGAAGGIAAIFGDLFESALKRDAGVKDSGSILPGHGGILDRFDSLIAVAPVTWLMLVYFGHLGG
jgi:phosphatidate cytidylyltransferase